MKQVSSSFLRSIHQKAGRLEERFGEELSKGKIPDELELKQIVNWNDQVSTPNGSLLATRKSWYIDQEEKLLKLSLKHQEENKSLTGWILQFKEILISFYIRGGQAGRPSFILKNEPVPFEELLIPWIEKAREEINWDKKLFSLDAISQCERDLLKELSKLSSACLLEAFDDFRKSTVSAKSGKYKAFIAAMYGGLANGFWETYAALARVMVDTVRQWKKGATLLMDRLALDQNLISDYFFEKEKLGLVTQIESDLTSRHTADGQVHILHFEGNNQIVYKPRPADQDLALSELLSWIQSKEVSFDFYTASTLNRVDYSWQALITYSSCNNEKEVETFYTRQGYFGGLFYVLGSTDYHFGNILAKGPYPVMIDNETLFSPIVKVQEKQALAGGSLSEDEIANSLAHSHFLIDKGRLLSTGESSIIGVFENEEQYPIHQFDPINEDAMTSYQAYRTRKGQNFALLNGQMTDPYDYVSCIKQGFKEMITWIQENVQSFYQAVSRFTDNFQLAIRVLIRSSVYYHQVLGQSLIPARLKNGIDRSIYFEGIASFYLQSSAEKEAKLLLNAEKAFLENYLVPWFYVRMDQDHYGDEPNSQNERSIICKSAKLHFEHRLTLCQNQFAMDGIYELLDHYYPTKI